MPSSPNRHRLEVPTALHARLEEEAQRRQMTAAALATVLLADALDRVGQERTVVEGPVLGEVRDVLRQLLEGEARQTAELQALRGELRQEVPQQSPVKPTRMAASPAAELAQAFNSQDWAELRVTEQAVGGKAKPFQDAFEGSTLPPAALEYLRLRLISDLTQSPDLRAEYLRQAEELRDQIAVPVLDRSIKGEQEE